MIQWYIGHVHYNLSSEMWQTFTNITFPITFNQILTVSTLSLLSDIGTTLQSGSTLIPAIECISNSGTVQWGCKNNGSANSKCYCQTLMVIGY